MWAACRPDSTPERTKRFRFGGSEDRVSISRKRKGLRSSAGKRDNRHPWVMSRVQAKSRWPHQKTKGNLLWFQLPLSIVLTAVPHGALLPSTVIEVTVQGESLYRMDSARRRPTWRCCRCAAKELRSHSTGVVQCRAASKIN